MFQEIMNSVGVRRSTDVVSHAFFSNICTQFTLCSAWSTCDAPGPLGKNRVSIVFQDRTHGDFGACTKNIVCTSLFHTAI